MAGIPPAIPAIPGMADAPGIPTVPLGCGPMPGGRPVGGAGISGCGMAAMFGICAIPGGRGIPGRLVGPMPAGAPAICVMRGITGICGIAGRLDRAKARDGLRACGPMPGGRPAAPGKGDDACTR